MIALRDEDGTLIGYYEKHEYRTPENNERLMISGNSKEIVSITIKLYLQRRTYIMNVEVKRDGLTLRGELVVPEKDSYDIAILMHGFTGNRNGELLTALADDSARKRGCFCPV